MWSCCIRYNPTAVSACYTRPSATRIHTFCEILTRDYHVMTTIRQTKGDDVDAACGQLAIVEVGTRGDTIAYTHDTKDIEVWRGRMRCAHTQAWCC